MIVSDGSHFVGLSDSSISTGAMTVECCRHESKQRNFQIHSSFHVEYINIKCTDIMIHLLWSINVL